MKEIKIESDSRKAIKKPFDKYYELFLMNNSDHKIFWSRDKKSDTTDHELQRGQEIRIKFINEYISIYSERAEGNIKFEWGLKNND